ncbi:MAG: CoA transferase, partial [Thermodesulfobacteriota bacterium]|nr:CoA transferase [Thermodesulfobacteriota bacterium]
YKIEPLNGDETRNVDTAQMGGESAVFMMLNRGKRSVCIDLDDNETHEILIKLAKEADIITENYMPGKTEEMGIDYESIKSINPGIIYCSFSAFGHSGPYMNRPGLDMAVQAMSGIMSITGEPEGRPMRPGFTVVDSTCGITAAYGIIAGLFNRERTGKGMQINLSLLDHAIAIQGTMVSLYFAKNENPPRMGNASPFTFAQDFKTGDGKYITFSIGHEGFWQKFRKTLGSKELMDDPRFASFQSFKTISDNMQDLVEICQRRFMEKDGKEWERLFIEGGIPCSLVNTYEEVFRDKQVQHNKMVLEFDHPKAKKIKLLRNPLLLNKKIITGENLPPPLLGQHTRESLLGIGFGNEQIDIWEEKGIIKALNQ